MTNEPITPGDLLGRDFATAVVMFHEAVAHRLGLTATDNRALDVLSRSGPTTAGDLARALHLTPGAVTGLADRLAAAGYITRVPDTTDRRRILLVVATDRMAARLQPLYEPFARDVAELFAAHSDDQQAAITAFLTDVTRTLRAHTERVTAPDGR
ncbi:MarR family transcriptional regulator [Rhodococcus sp. CX]|uniref:MarR family transcriptional regulator n=1 Tax=Rhodococcus sp. CX TaxID=2789880 RepID=UPI0018CCD936|nr:MarR family transcriptional regulator [Rhodococcus sp. CX]MBH0122649.1 MarR family transcriptional regulator [Rhodococcus sp. CX]